jgi:hypothetical protein
MLAGRGHDVARLFISQERIDKLAADDRVVIDGDRLEIPALGATFRLRPAVHFVRLVSDEHSHGDTQHLVGRVKTEEQLRALGADVVAHSALVGDSAYECENGFVGEVISSGASWTGGLKQLPD